MNKPKIDLKARLGKRPGGTPASASIPPPVGINPGPPSAQNPMMGGMIGGHPGHQPGAFAPPQSQAPRPAFDALGVAAVQAPPAPMRAPVAATSALEAEEAFIEVRKSSRIKTIVLAAGTALVGGILGFAIGGLSERNSVAEIAVAGAKQLSADIDEANKKVAELEQVVTAAGKALKDGKYPDKEVKELGGLNVPFDGTNLAGKGIGRFKPQVVTMLINYAEAVAKVNTQKDKIRSVLSVAKPAVEDLLAQNTNPQVRWGLTVQSGPQGPWGVLGPLPAAFPVSGETGSWPAQIELKNDRRVKRYSGGDANGTLIPVAPQSHNAVCPNDTMVRLRREVADLDRLISGDQTPGQESDGIIQMGEALRKQLAGIGG